MDIDGDSMVRIDDDSTDTFRFERLASATERDVDSGRYVASVFSSANRRGKTSRRGRLLRADLSMCCILQPITQER